MATGSINVNVRGLDPNGISTTSSVQTTESKKLKQNEPIRVEVKLKDTKPPSNTDEPTTEEILGHVKNVLRTSSNVAHSVGADDTAEILDHSADIAERIPVAVAGIKREIQPVRESVGSLMSALERKGIVGYQPKVNLGDMRKKK